LDLITKHLNSLDKSESSFPLTYQIPSDEVSSNKNNVKNRIFSMPENFQMKKMEKI
jgi:hypothetical protein